MTKNTALTWSGVWVSALMATVVWSIAAQTRGTGASSQQMLDFLAKPAPASGVVSNPTDLPSHFADWTEAQQRSGLQVIVQHCALINALEHDNPESRILPAPMTKMEEAELAISVCLPAKMPIDWPERRKYLDDAQRLIAKANAHGSALHLPVDLVQK